MTDATEKSQAPIFGIDETGKHCIGCGYDLRGLVVPRCPECGEVFSAKPQALLCANKSARRYPFGARTAWRAFIFAIVLLGALLATKLLLQYPTQAY